MNNFEFVKVTDQLNHQPQLIWENLSPTTATDVHNAAAATLELELQQQSYVHTVEMPFPPPTESLQALPFRLDVKKNKLPLDCDKDESLKNAISPYVAMMMDCPCSTEGLTYHKGEFVSFFEHLDFPGLALQVVNKDSAEKMLEIQKTYLEIVVKYDLSRIIIPQVALIPLENDLALFVIEKDEGSFSPYASREISEREFENFVKPRLEDRRWECFLQAAVFVCKAEMSINWHTVSLTKKGFCIFNFKPSDDTIDLEKILAYLAELLKLAPPKFFDIITSVAEKCGVSKEKIYQKAFNVSTSLMAKQEREKELAIRTELRQWHDKNNITHPKKKFNETYFVNLEKTIIQKFNETIDANAELFYGCLIAQRTLNWQPFACELDVSELSKFESALSELSRKNIIATWSVAHSTSIPVWSGVGEPPMVDQRLNTYSIYF